MATVNTLVVAGGGGGADGGGGAGGYLADTALTVTAQAYTITVGAGGAGSGTTAANGGDSTFSTLTATGGGKGGDGGGAAGSGGSGGGQGSNNSGAGSAGTGTAGQGNDGGTRGGFTSAPYPSGGGGGAGAVGSNAPNSSTSGDGGAGTANSISGSSVTYAGGGGGGIYASGTAGAGGTGGGGAGGTTSATAGTANTGGGGGGASASNNGNAGGSGIVIIRFATDGSDGITTDSTGGTITTDGTDTIHTFTTSGTFTAVVPVNYVVNHDTLKTNLVSWWSLNEESDGTGAVTRYDAHGSNDLTDNNTTASATGLINRGADFESGNSEYLEGADTAALELTGNFSVSYWCNPETISLGYSAEPFGKMAGGSGWAVQQLTSGVVRFVRNNATAHATTVTGVTAGAWNHVVFTYDGTNTKAYLNGTLKQTVSMSALPTNTAKFRMSGSDQNTTRYYDGLLSDVGIWSKELSTDEISDLYNSGQGMTYGIDLDATAGHSPPSATTSSSWSHTTTGTDRCLWVSVNLYSGDYLSDVTYDSVSMTEVTTVQTNSGYTTLLYLANPTEGANNITVTTSTSTDYSAESVSYVGVDQTSPLDASASAANFPNASNPETLGVTSTVDYAWAILGGGGDRQPSPINTGTDRTTSGVGSYAMDSGGAIASAGLYTFSYDTSTGGNNGHIAAAFKPVQVAAPASTFTPKITFF